MKHHRRSIRLTGYDYSQAGAYFVTVCTRQRECVFGEVSAEAGMCLNEYGGIAQKVWDALPGRYTNVKTDEFVIMPNHIHGIIVITTVGAIHELPLQRELPLNVNCPYNVNC